MSRSSADSPVDAMALACQERVELADFLASLGPEQWEHPSLCRRWRVRDVAAHAISYEEHGSADLVRRLAKARFHPGRVNAASTGRGEADPRHRDRRRRSSWPLRGTMASRTSSVDRGHRRCTSGLGSPSRPFRRQVARVAALTARTRRSAGRRGGPSRGCHRSGLASLPVPEERHLLQGDHPCTVAHTARGAGEGQETACPGHPISAPRAIAQAICQIAAVDGLAGVRGAT